MDVYRLATVRRANDLSGQGSRRVSGRWNHVGAAVLYTAASRALATLEVLVHMPLAFLPDDYRMLTLHLPDESLQTISSEALPDGWTGLTPPDEIKQLIDDWIKANQYLVLQVPSAIVEGDFNLLVNPAHPRAAEVVIIENKPYQFDTKLLRQ